MDTEIIYIPIKEKSQRVPNKNFRHLDQVPLWMHTVNKLKNFRVFIDTDSKHIIDECKMWDNVIAFERDVTLIGHDVSVCDLISNFIDRYSYEHTICQLHVTNPFLTVDTVTNALSYMDKGHDSVISCNVFQRRLWRKEPYGYCPVNHNPVKLEPTQDLPRLLEENSSFYIFDANMFKRTNMRVGINPYFYEIDFPENLDIDNEDDWDLCCLYNKSLITS